MSELTHQIRPRWWLIITATFIFWPHIGTTAEIFRWQDSSGNTHYADQPPVTGRERTTIRHTSFDSQGRVATVIDGDTLLLTDGRRVRLLGIDTPEVAHHGRPGEPMGEQAKQFLQSLVEDQVIRLRFDQQHYDRYHRLLAHIYLEDGKNLNALVLEQGLAHALFKWPNLKHAKRYYELEKHARQKRRGIWALPGFQIKSLHQLEDQRNRFIRVRGRITRSEQKRRYHYLHFDGKLIVAVDRERLPLFERAGIRLKSLNGRRITLRGFLRQRKSGPFLKLEQPYQLEQIE